MEDFVTWTHTSAIRKHVMEYNEMVGYQYLTFSDILYIKYTLLSMTKSEDNAIFLIIYLFQKVVDGLEWNFQGKLPLQLLWNGKILVPNSSGKVSPQGQNFWLTILQWATVQ